MDICLLYRGDTYGIHYFLIMLVTERVALFCILFNIAIDKWKILYKLNVFNKVLIFMELKNSQYNNI